MKKNFLLAIVFLPVLFSACKNTNEDPKDRLVHELVFEALPAYQKLSEFRRQMLAAEFRNLLWIETPGESEEKLTQSLFINDTYPTLRRDLQDLSTTQNAEEKEKINHIIESSDKQILLFKQIMSDLSSVAAYNDPTILLPDQSMVLDNDGECFLLKKDIQDHLDSLLWIYNSEMSSKQTVLLSLSEK